MAVKISVEPRELKSKDGVVVKYMPLKNTAWMNFLSKNKEIIEGARGGEEGSAFSIPMDDAVFNLISEHIIDIEGFYVDGEECNDPKLFIEYYPDVSFVLDIFSELMASKLSVEEVKN
ncbi:MAG: hypothetical protein D6816_04695 [Bacteroidetes bacterium]|nr:MAG: hypothetical protein D6816_04695 [Bacteroidota bacterium]